MSDITHEIGELGELNDLLNDVVRRYQYLQHETEQKQHTYTLQVAELPKFQRFAFEEYLEKIKLIQTKISDELAGKCAAESKYHRFEVKAKDVRRRIAESQIGYHKISRQKMLEEQERKLQSELDVLIAQDQELDEKQKKLMIEIENLSRKVEDIEIGYEHELSKLVSLVYQVSAIEDNTSLVTQIHDLECQQLGQKLSTITIYDINQFARKQKHETLVKVEKFYDSLLLRQMQTDEKRMVEWFELKKTELDHNHLDIPSSRGPGPAPNIKDKQKEIDDFHAELTKLKDERLKLTIELKDWETSNQRNDDYYQVQVEQKQQVIFQIRLKVGIIIKKNISLQNELNIYRSLLQAYKLREAPPDDDDFTEFRSVEHIEWTYRVLGAGSIVEYSCQKHVGDNKPSILGSFSLTETDYKVLRTGMVWKDFLEVLKLFVSSSKDRVHREKVFNLLDTDHDGTVDIDELTRFVKIIFPGVKAEDINYHFRQIGGDKKINPDQFAQLLERDITREIVIRGFNRS